MLKIKCEDNTIPLRGIFRYGTVGNTMCVVNVLFKNVPTPASFCLFWFYSITILQKNCRLQWDSNLEFQSNFLNSASC